MEQRTREWLRSFLDLGARAEKDSIPVRDIERQEDTVLRALEMLDEQPGVVLCDEVGMGKTFEALGLAAAIARGKRKRRIVVIAPGPDLTVKWFNEFSRFKEMYDFGDQVVSARRLHDFMEKVEEHPIVVAPVTMFQSGKSDRARAYLLSLYCHWKGLHPNTANAIMKRSDTRRERPMNVRGNKFLGRYAFPDVEPHLGRAFRRGRRGGVAGLDDLFEEEGIEGFESESAVRNALYRARFTIVGGLMPMIDLLIVDEAHKLKNSRSLRSRGMRTVFAKRFHKAAFLTATPFQLDVSELREVFHLFGLARGAPPDVEDQVFNLLEAVREYQETYDEFQITWSRLDPELTAEFRRLYESDPELRHDPEDASLRIVANSVRRLLELKSTVVEPGFRRWMIRSLREDKRSYRNPIRESLRAESESVLPFVLYERFIAELFRQKRQTHKAAVEINMVSSYAAAQKGALFGKDVRALPEAAEKYRTLLGDVLEDIEANARAHPKVAFDIDDAVSAADSGEKTLVFCSRIATLEELRRELADVWEKRLVRSWQRAYPGAAADELFDRRDEDERRRRGRHSLLQARFHRATDSLSLALRERYLRTVVPIEEWAGEHVEQIVEAANSRLMSLALAKTAAERIDYEVAQRCVEQAAVELYRAAGHDGFAHTPAAQAILEPDFLLFGLDLARDEFQRDPSGDLSATWKVDERIARLAFDRLPNIWERVSDLLDQLEVSLRVRVVEQMARYLTYKEVEFLPDLLAAAASSGVSVDSIESASLLEFVDRFWDLPEGEVWARRIREFLEYFVNRDEKQRLDILDGPIRTGDFVRHTKDGESRERLREAFNTPLFPMILLANEVMQEGLDLHKQCRRIVHHDLAWNPAQIEQRIGRIDRLGSKTLRLRERGENAKLDVLYPIVHGTIDERMYRAVKTREKWIEFLLGAEPRFDEYGFGDEESAPLPEGLGQALAIDLGPRAKH